MATNNWRADRARTAIVNFVRSAYGIALLIGLVYTLVDASEVGAQTVRQWTGPAGGSWYSGANWTPAGVPLAYDYLYLSTGDSASSPSAVYAEYGGVIDVDNGASLTVGGNLNIGNQGEGTLDVRDGAVVVANTNFFVGNGGTGVARIQGVSTGLGVAFDTFIGLNGGRGTLEVRQNAVVSYAGVAIVGYGADSDGSVLVDTGGDFNSLSLVPLTIGSSGSGTLEIRGGGSASSTGATLASGATGSGQVIVDGDGSLWDIDGGANGLLIGFAGSATMDVTAGGRVESNEAFLGHIVGSSGSASVRGADSLWNVAGMLTVGNGDNGTLEVVDGGEVISQGAVITSGPGATGSSAELRGADSHWNVGGDLVVGSSGLGSLLVEGGALVESTGNSTYVADGSTATNSTVTVTGGGSRWYHSGSIRIGRDSVGKVNVVAGGSVQSAAVQLGANTSGNGRVDLDGAGSRWDSSSTFIVGNNGDATLNVTGGALLSSNAGIIANNASSVATATVDGTGSEWSTTANLSIAPSGKGGLTVSGGGHVDVGTTTSIGALGTLTIDGGSLTTQSLTDTAGGTLSIQDGTITVDGGAFNPGGSFVLNGTGGTATLNLRGTTGSFIAGSLTVGNTGDAVLNIEQNHYLEVNGALTVGNQGSVNLDGGGLLLYNGGNVSADNLHFNGGSLYVDTGTLTVNSGLTVPDGGQLFLQSTVAGQLASQPGSLVQIDGAGASMGDASSYDGVRLQGALTVGSGREVTFLSAGFSELGSHTTLTNGTITAAGGVALGSGDVLTGYGTINAKVAAATGSLISVTSDSDFGDSGQFDGFVSDGNLTVDSVTLTLRDRNQATLGAITSLVSDATIDAANGLVVDFGDTVEGFGTLDTPDDPAKPTIINGHVEGDSPANAIALSGYVKGVGTFNNAVFTGTHAPGFSPAAISVGNIAYGNTATLEIELGGTTAGSQFDQVNGTGAIAVDGTLDVALIDGFSPSQGDSFDILTALGGITGTFDTEVLPTLAGNLVFDVLYAANTVSLVVELPGDYNFDGEVDAADYTVWRDTLGQTGPGLAADGNGDNVITEADYDLWKTNYGATAGSGAGSLATATVPEPASAVLLLAAGLALASRRRARACGSQL